jgi:lysophospholipase L1-like esterase
MPTNYYYRCVATNGSSVWDFNQWRPDLIVINLGQNDESRGAEKQQFITGYVNFVNMLRAKYNDDKTRKIPIILALGDMGVVKKGSPWPGYIAQVAKSLRKDYSDKNIYRVVFPYCGLNSHPHAEQHSDMAKQLTKFITKNIPAFTNK